MWGDVGLCERVGAMAHCVNAQACACHSACVSFCVDVCVCLYMGLRLGIGTRSSVSGCALLPGLLAPSPPYPVSSGLYPGGGAPSEHLGLEPKGCLFLGQVCAMLV